MGRSGVNVRRVVVAVPIQELERDFWMAILNCNQKWRCTLHGAQLPSASVKQSTNGSKVAIFDSSVKGSCPVADFCVLFSIPTCSLLCVMSCHLSPLPGIPRHDKVGICTF